MKHRFIAVILSVFILLIPNTAADSWASDLMQVHFIDVGQGDSILIETPSDKTILIDGGPPEAGKKVTSYLRKMNIRSIDLSIATHPDYDHIGGLVDVMKNVEVKKVIDSGKLHFTRTYAKYTKELKKKNIPVQTAKEGDCIKIDSNLKIDVLNANDQNKNNNQSSIALKISYKEVDFLLMSDVGMAREKNMLNRADLGSEIIKVAHHGSDTSTSMDFLKEVQPKIAVLTYSRRNDYGHPVERVIKNLDLIDTLVYPTAVFGDVVIVTNGEKYYLFTGKRPLDSIAVQHPPKETLS